MKLFYASYELEADAPMNAVAQALKRPGALLKVQFDAGRTGYADCHAWPELGDLPLPQQLDSLASSSLTPITRCALEWAKVDAEARFEGKALLTQEGILKNHYLISDLISWTSDQTDKIEDQGFTHVKLKVGRQSEAEAEALCRLFSHSSLKLRLDFNETLTPIAFGLFCGRSKH